MLTLNGSLANNRTPKNYGLIKRECFFCLARCAVITNTDKEFVMKTIKFATLFLSLSMILTANVVLAHSENDHEKNVKSTMSQFMVLGATTAILQLVANSMSLAPSSKNVLHLSNVLVQGGIICDKPALTDLGIRAVLASSAAATAINPLIKTNIVHIPLIGQRLAAAGEKGTAITTVAFYEMIKQGYITAIDKMPASVQKMIRGE